MTEVVFPQNIRIPNLPTTQITREDGTATQEFMAFMQTLITQLQLNFGSEGMVAPSQPADNVTIIQDNINQQYPGGLSTYTCQFGTFIYIPNTADLMTDPPNDEVVVSVNNGSDAPLFSQIVISQDTSAVTAGVITNYATVNLGGTLYKIALYALS